MYLPSFKLGTVHFIIKIQRHPRVKYQTNLGHTALILVTMAKHVQFQQVKDIRKMTLNYFPGRGLHSLVVTVSYLESLAPTTVGSDPARDSVFLHVRKISRQFKGC
jgi:hypothetical protein